MRNANRLTLVLWMLFPLLATAQVLPPITRSVLTTNIPAFGSAGQALFRISIPPYLNWSNIVAGLSITESNNIINLASNYTYAVSNYAYTASNSLAGQIVTASNSVLNASSNYTFAVSNLVVASTNGQFIEKLNGIGTNTTIRQVNQTGPALTIGTNSGAVFSIMGVTNGPSKNIVQIGSGMLADNSGGTNMLIGGTNGNWSMSGSLTAIGGLTSGADVTASTAGFLGFNGLSKICSPTNGTIKMVENAMTVNYLTRTSGVTLLFEPVRSLPVPAANVGVFTNNALGGSQWGIGNTNGTLAFMTATNGTNRIQFMELNPTNGATVNHTLTASNLLLSQVRWVDSPVQLNWSATGPSAPPAVSVAAGSQILAPGFTVAGIGTEKVYGQFQINHNVCASNATVYTEHHLHVSPTNAPGAGSSNIAFTIVYDWANISGTRFGPYTNTVQIGLTAQTYNNLIEMGHQTNFFPTISAISRCTIYRSAAASNEYNHTVILDGADVHYPIDRLGSASDIAP